MKKKSFLFLVIFTFSYLSAQTKEKSNFLYDSEFGFHGGLSFISLSQGWETFIFEGKSHLTDDLLVKLSIGYSRIISPVKYVVKSYSVITWNGTKIYQPFSFNVFNTTYKVIPISLGLQYNINYSKFNPYVLTEIGYNMIDPKLSKSPRIYGEKFNSYDELPQEYKYINILPNGSYKLAVGVGFKYPITSVLSLDLRYLTQIDSEIINTQQLLVGIIF